MAIYKQLIYLLKMLMFHSYISLPEGNPHCESAHIIPFFVADHQLIDQTTPGLWLSWPARSFELLPGSYLEDHPANSYNML